MQIAPNFKHFPFRIRSLGTAALTLCYVAMGAVEAYHIESIDAWDVAAGKLIIEEAGGVVIDTAGKYYFPTDIYPSYKFMLSTFSDFEI